MSRSNWIRGLAVVFSLVLGGHLVQAAKVKVWYHQAPTAFDKAQLKQAVVTSEGALRLSRQVKPLDRKSTRLNSSHIQKSRMPSSA